MLRLLRSTPGPDAHAEVFIERYESLFAWALKFSENDRDVAEDLVHDTFVQFILIRPELNAIHNLDAYLYTMLKNSHLSQVRRASQKPQNNLALVEYDSAEISLRVVDVRLKMQVDEELWKVCQYACLRKDSSKAGSVLILRFFHGYYPSEICKIIRSTRSSADSWLRIARREVHLYLSDANSLLCSKQSLVTTSSIISQVRSKREVTAPEDLLGALRASIFATRQGSCLNSKQMRQLYTQNSNASIPTELLGHIVSCVQCLDLVNKTIDLPPLSDRDPGGMLGPDKGSKPGDERIFGAGKKKQPLNSCLKRFNETFEHRPKELRIAVNGYVLATQKLSAEINEQELNLDAESKVNFIEIFSEQNLRLLLLNVEAPPEGAFEQQQRIDLSDDRFLEASLSFSGTWPRLNVSYRDPLISKEVDSESVIEEEELGVDAEVVGWPGDNSPYQKFRRLFKLPDGETRSVFWLRPGLVTVVVALLLIAAVVFVKFRHAPVVPDSASELLSRAASAEKTNLERTDQVIHRTMTLEESQTDCRSPNSDCATRIIARQQVDIWQSAEKGITARRLYDEHGKLVAGDWRRADGVQTVYEHGHRPQLQPVPEKSDRPVGFNRDSIWQLSPSAKEFSRIVGGGQQLTLEESANSYSVTYESPVVSSGSSALNSPSLFRGTLVLSKSDLHATEMTLRIADQNRQSASDHRQWHEFHIVETSFERRPANAVAPAVFEPEPELLGDEGMGRRGDAATISMSSSLRVPASSAIATPALEVEVLELLNNVGAFMGEQLRITRINDGKLLVTGLVESSERKTELLAVLSSVRRNPTLRIEIETVAEAARRERSKTTGKITVDRIEATEGSSPVYSELRKKFSDDEARRFADRILSRSSQARSHALALKQLAGRFSQADLESLSKEDRGRWLGLLKGHAVAFEREVEALQKELQFIFPALSEPRAIANRPMADDEQIQEAARRLYELGVSCDEALRQSFALSSSNNSEAPVKTVQFWASLMRAKALASTIQAIR